MNTTLIDLVMDLAQGNPGAMKVCMALLAAESEKYPEADNKKYMLLLVMQKIGLRGENIWMLYKDECNQDLDAFRFRVCAMGIARMTDPTTGARI